MIKKEIKVGGRSLILETGRFAEQANAAVTCTYGGTVVLATVVSASAREDIDYFPLFVEYQEKLYAAGKIKGSRWVKREGKPSEEAILAARLIDRSIRPLFPKDYRNEVQVVVTILSADTENEPEIPGILATSAALAISDIPWEGPVAAIRLSNKKDNTFFVNPTYDDLKSSNMDVVISGNVESLIMFEGEAREVKRDTLLKGFVFAHKEIKKIIALINDFQKEAGRKKQAVKPKVINKKLALVVEKEMRPCLKDFFSQTRDFREFKRSLVEKLETKESAVIADEIFKKTLREQVLTKKIRIDGRKPDQIREIKIETSLLPRTHGSAMFKRGATQALTIITLGSPSLGQLIESMIGEETKRYMHHYYMPPYSVGETGRFGWPSRREIGHGALAERALEPVLPTEAKFPYTIRVVSEIMSSNGSSSMAAVCGSSLSLMDAGVPITKPVAGIAMGIIKGDKTDDYVILTDILGVEDHCGDMDCKIAGTKDGITALQMDVKKPLPLDFMKTILEKAHQARISILEEMVKIMPASRTKVSQYAPKIKVINIAVDKIGEVIGPGGKMIRRIISETGAAIDVNDQGEVTISGKDKESVAKAVEWVNNLTREVKVNEMFDGEVKRIQPFGAFVEILPGKEGLVHISKMAKGFIKDPSEVVEIGQKVKVKVVEIDERKRINLSMLLDEEPGSRPERRSSQPDRFGKPSRFSDRSSRSKNSQPRRPQRDFRSRAR